MKTKILTFLSIALALSTGCVPIKRVQWTADGKFAFVVTPKDGLHMIDADGKILSSKIEGGVKEAAWTHDGKHLVAAREIKVKTWDELTSIMKPEQIEAIRHAAAIEKSRLLAHTGDWDSYKFAENSNLSDGMNLATLIYLRDKDPAGLHEKAGEKWKDIENLEFSISQLQMFDHQNGVLNPGTVLLKSLDGASNLSISPDDECLAFNMKQWNRNQADPALYVLSIRKGLPFLVDGPTAAGCAWSPNSRQLAYMFPASPTQEGSDTLQLGSLATVTVRNQEGEIVEPQDKKDVAGLIYDQYICIYWMKDGRILFVSAELTLPATRHEMPQQWSLFALDPRMPARVIPIFGRDMEAPLDAGPMFEMSPDESRVLLPRNDGQIAIYEFATASVTLIPDAPIKDAKMTTLPAWRGNDEVCFALASPPLADHAKTQEMAIWRNGQITLLSEKWPEEMKADWLKE